LESLKKQQIHTINTLATSGQETGVETPELPKTSFTCSNKPHIPGLYADCDAQCTLFHYCYDDQDAVFACPPNTLFSQEKLICDWPENVNCADSPNHYESNKGIGEAIAEETAQVPTAPVKVAVIAPAPIAPAPVAVSVVKVVKKAASVQAPISLPSTIQTVEARVQVMKSKQIAALRRGPSAIRKTSVAGIKA
jgi:hypothetical protein